MFIFSTAELTMNARIYCRNSLRTITGMDDNQDYKRRS